MLFVPLLFLRVYRINKVKHFVKIQQCLLNSISGSGIPVMIEVPIVTTSDEHFVDLK